MIHHIAIGTPDPERLKIFYLNIPGLIFEKDFFFPNGELRSSWILAGNLRIMLEKEKEAKAPHALVFSALDPIEQKNLDTKFSELYRDSTTFTKYFLDPDGNRLGFSSYPQVWEG